MRLSIKWLQDYVNVADCNPTALAEQLTNAGLEIEGIESLAQGTNLCVGQVLECKPHPDSDHLHVCQVDVGSAVQQIVCGAPNVAVNQKVIVANVGAVLPQLTIKAGVIRGIASNGMICSLLELGVDAKYLNEEQKNGIEVLPEHAQVGDTNPLGCLGLDDVILDVGLTPNRSDCLAMYSFAKEIGAVLDRPVTLPKSDEEYEESKSNLVVGSTTKRCELFLGKYIGQVKIQESPAWMKERLMAVGIKSINNVVDISNYVMLETGQPLHFYDASKITNKEITVKDGYSGTYQALDGMEYEILEEDIMITTYGKFIGIAGIMGGEDSKIDEHTKSIIIEAANFDHVSIRNTSRRIGIGTEASIRFQKGIEPLAPYIAMQRAVELLVEWAEAKELEETVTYATKTYEPTKVFFTLSFINQRLGTSFTQEEVLDVMRRLDFSPEEQKEGIQVTIPSYRTDIKIPDDISEEVIRILGYDRLQSTLPMMPMTVGALSDKQATRRTTQSLLIALGIQEVETYTLIGDALVNRAVMPLGESVRLLSPLSEERKYIRNSLLPSVLESVQYNYAHFASEVNVFEWANVYAPEMVNERLAIVLGGQLQALPWKKQAIAGDFYTLKGIIVSILEKYGLGSNRVFIKENTLDLVHFHPKQSAVIYLDKHKFGVFGVIHPRFAKEYDLKNIVMAELDMEILHQMNGAKVKFVALPKYPSIRRDLAIVVDRKLEAKKIVDCVRKCNRTIIQEVQIFDVYEGEHVAANEKSVALSIVYHALDRTLTDVEIGGVQESIIAALQKECNAILRR